MKNNKKNEQGEKKKKKTKRRITEKTKTHSHTQRKTKKNKWEGGPKKGAGQLEVHLAPGLFFLRSARRIWCENFVYF